MTALRVPILMYHAIAESAEAAHRMTVSASAFAAQLAYLHNAGFKTITAGAYAAALSGDTEELSDRTVVLTFDDGYENFHSRAMPLLDQYGFTATVFVTTGWVEDAEAGLARRGRPGQMLTWSQIEEAASAGIEIGAHSDQHPQLDQLPERLLREELYKSKQRLEGKLGQSVPGLAYPFGYSNARVRQVSREAGYDYGYAVRNVVADQPSDLFALPRLTVKRSTTMHAFHELIHTPVPTTLLKERAFTKGWAMVRRARATLKLAGSRGV